MQAAVGPWTELGAALGDCLNASERAAWCGLALELLTVAGGWDTARLAAFTRRWRNFIHLLLLDRTDLASDAPRVLACERETLAGPLYAACLTRRPGQSPAELDALRACGVG